jgi:hypothetical protein
MFTNCSVFSWGITVESQETIYKKFIIEHYISVEGHGLARD